MQRLFMFFYGILASLAWAATISIIIFRPFHPTINNRAMIAFTIAAIILTLIWLLIIAPVKTRKPRVRSAEDLMSDIESSAAYMVRRERKDFGPLPRI